MVYSTATSYNDSWKVLPPKRKLFAPQAKMSTKEGADLLANIKPDVVLRLVLRAGQEALRCSGRGWYPQSDIQVTAGAARALQLRLAGFKRLELSVNPPVCIGQCGKLHQDGVGANPISIMENTAGALVRLFAGYYAICPWDAWRHRNLVNAALWGAYRSQWVSSKERELAIMVALFFERSVVSHALTEAEGRMFVEGLACERAVNQVPYHLLTALFERTQAMLFPKAWRQVAQTFSREPSPVADALVADVMFLLFDGRVRSVRGKLRLRGKTGRPKSWEWVSRVERLAELLVPYLERQQEDNEQPPSPNPFYRPGEGDGPGGLEPGEGLAPPHIDPQTEPHPFVDADGVGPRPGDTVFPPEDGGTRPGMGPPRPPRYDDFETIDRYYTKRANALMVRDKTDNGPKREPDRITIGYLDNEEASVLDLLDGQIDWSRCRIGTPDAEHPGGLQLFRRTEPLDIPAGGDVPASHGLPHLLIVVDSSGSMAYSPPTDGPAGGNYDLVLMAAWGMFRYIQECENTEGVKVNALNFSSATIASGWHPSTQIEPVKRILASYFGGGTRLDVMKLREAFDTSPGEFLTVVITDGGLGNTPAALEGFEKIVKAGNHVVLLHIGQANPFTQGIEALGCPTHLLTKAEDLVGLCLDLAKSRYDQRIV